MASQYTDAALIHLMSHHSDFLTNAGISVDNAASHFAISRGPSSPELAPIERFPLEVLHNIVGKADVKAVVQFAGSSISARQAVETLPAYQILLQHASHLLAVLGHTNTTHLHTIEQLHRALETPSCVSCGEFAPYLCLLTCERCCYSCLETNPSMWVLKKKAAELIFHLSPEDLDQVPSARFVPKQLRRTAPARTNQPKCLVSVKAVKQLSLRVHGSIDDFLDALAPWNSDDHTYMQLRACGVSTSGLTKALQAPLTRHASSAAVLRLVSRRSTDRLGTMACYVPVLDPTFGVEQVLWCKGCWRVHRDYDMHTEISKPDDVNYWDIVLPSPDIEETLRARRNRAWPRSQFVEHARACRGVAKILEVPVPNDLLEASDSDWEH